MNSNTRTRLTKLLGMTGSSHDAEALIAIRMACHVLAKAGLTWEQVMGATIPNDAAVTRAFEDGHRKGYAEGLAKGRLAAKNAPASRPRAWRAIVEEMLHRGWQLTEWEEKFLQSFLYRKYHTPTPRQHAVMARIADKLGIRVPPPVEPVQEPDDEPPF